MKTDKEIIARVQKLIDDADDGYINTLIQVESIEFKIAFDRTKDFGVVREKENESLSAVPFYSLTDLPRAIEKAKNDYLENRKSRN
jgi:hypothetical protein